MSKVQGDTVERIAARLKEMNTFLYKIFELTGISPGELTQSIETATEAKQAYASTNDALVSIAKAYNNVKLNAAKTVEMRLQSAMLIPTYLKDTYGDILSDYDIEMLNIAKNNSARYGMDITIRPSEREIAKMEEAAKNTAGVKDANVNFMTLKMSVEFEEGQDPKAVMQDVLKNCKKVEDDCEIYL